MAYVAGAGIFLAGLFLMKKQKEGVPLVEPTIPTRDAEVTSAGDPRDRAMVHTRKEDFTSVGNDIYVRKGQGANAPYTPGMNVEKPNILPAPKSKGIPEMPEELARLKFK